MVWVRLDEHFPDHPKVLKAGPLAGWLHVCALAYSNRYLTDGFVPAAVLRTLASFDGISTTGGGDVTPEQLAGVLVDSGVWDETTGGFVIHHFADYQPTREQVLAEREAAKRRRARRSPDVRPTFSDPVPDTETGSVFIGSTVSDLDPPGPAAEMNKNGNRNGHGPVTWETVHEHLSGADERTPEVIRRASRGLPEAALRMALESLETRRQDKQRKPLISEVRYFVAALNNMRKEGQFS